MSGFSSHLLQVLRIVFTEPVSVNKHLLYACAFYWVPPSVGLYKEANKWSCLLGAESWILRERAELKGGGKSVMAQRNKEAVTHTTHTLHLLIQQIPTVCQALC